VVKLTDCCLASAAIPKQIVQRAAATADQRSDTCAFAAADNCSDAGANRRRPSYG